MRLNKDHWKSSWLVLVLALVVIPLGGRAQQSEENQPATSAKAGLQMSSDYLKVGVGATIHLDFVGFDDDEENIPGAGSQENDFIVRRARLILKGSFNTGVGFFLQAGFDRSGVPVYDAVIMLPVGDDLEVRAGQMKAPFSQERLRSYATQPFMERGLGANLELQRTQGVMAVYNPGGGPLDLYLGYFTGETMNAHSTDDHFEYDARITLKPNLLIDALPGEGLIGAAYSRGRRLPENGAVTSFSGKTMNGLVFFDGVPVNGYRTRWEADYEWRVSSLHWAAEYIHDEEQRTDVTVPVDTNGDGLADTTWHDDLDPLTADGWMAYLVWVVTGEPYTEHLTPQSKYGALELAVRYSQIKFDTGGDISLGPGLTGVEVNTASQALGRPAADETVQDLYVGATWILQRGVFIQGAVIQQWFDDSSPTLHQDDNTDLNYRARIGVIF